MGLGGAGLSFLPELWESGLGTGSRRLGAKSQQSRQQAEREPEAQHGDAGPQPAVGRTDVAREALAAAAAHGRRAEVDARDGADRGAALVQGVAQVHHVPDASGCRDGHTVAVRIGADGGLQAVPAAVLIHAREAHQGVGSLHTQEDSQQHRQEDLHSGGVWRPGLGSHEAWGLMKPKESALLAGGRRSPARPCRQACPLSSIS